MTTTNIDTSSPTAVMRTFSDLVHARDLDGLVSLYEPTAVFEPAPGDVALVVNEWSMTGTAPDGTEVRQGGRSADVVRRQADGSWLVVVDKP